MQSFFKDSYYLYRYSVKTLIYSNKKMQFYLKKLNSSLILGNRVWPTRRALTTTVNDKGKKFDNLSTRFQHQNSEKHYRKNKNVYLMDNVEMLHKFHWIDIAPLSSSFLKMLLHYVEICNKLASFGDGNIFFCLNELTSLTWVFVCTTFT